MNEDKIFMDRAIRLAGLAEREGNLPVGAVIVFKEEVVAEGRSVIWVPRFDATRHAEMEALRGVPSELWQYAAQMSVYTTLEPCLMCFGSILLHGIGRVVYGSADDYAGAGITIPSLPPLFKERLSEIEWTGPIMPEQCDPLHERLLALEAERVSSRSDSDR